MELNLDSARELLNNPTPAVEAALAQAPAPAQAALAEARANTGTTIQAPVVESSSSLPARGERVQVVDEEKKFSKDLTPAISRWGLLDKGFGYDVVAVFGSQSTGKSTLLNRLFGTTFDVMDEKARQQTTKGIWMCKAKDHPIMVMDVEGTDGRERGEDQDFERKSALFSLASSEILLVNLWEHQVGLYQGANMGLLKTVFEVNLGLFGASRGGGKEKTLLLFVIRDHVGSTPMSNLTATLTQDMERIWHSLAKPEGLQNASLSEYFDLAFTALPHKVLMPEQFESAVVDLRDRFTDRTRADFLFKPAYHKRIPADGVAFYMEGIWEQVQSNSDLDIPTQQELLAQFRCDEIAAGALEAFATNLKGVKRPVETGQVVEGLGGMLGEWKTAALAHFDRDASRYHAGTYKRKRAELVTAVDIALSPLFLGHIKNVHKAVVRDFKRELLEALQSRDYDFGTLVETGRAKAEKTFTDAAEEVRLKDTDWQYEDELALVKEDVSLIADQCRSDETKKMVNLIERNVKKQLAEPVEFLLNKPTPELWDAILKQFHETLDRAEATYLERAKSFNCTEAENAASLATLRRRSWLALRAKADEQTADTILLSKLRTAFEERFRYDELGVPRVWKPEDDIDEAFRKAKDETLRLLPIYSTISPSDSSLLPTNIPSDSASAALTTDLDLDLAFDFESSLVLLGPTKVADLEQRFRREADALYIEAKRSMVASRAMIPVWVYAAICILGFNEFMAVLTSPLYFTTLLVLLVSAYFVHKFGLSGPLIQVVMTVYREIHRQAVDKLREAFKDGDYLPSGERKQDPRLVPAPVPVGVPRGSDGEIMEK